MSRPTRRPRYADVAATLALVLALGSTTAYAVQTLPKNSVGKKQLQKAAVTSKKIKDGKVKAKDLAPGSISAGQLADGGVTSAKIANGTIGPGDIGVGSVGASEIGANAVNGAKVIDNSLSLGDMVGVDVTASVPFPLVPPSGCEVVSVVVAGVQAGQSAIVTLAGVSPSTALVFGPARVTGSTISMSVCNLGGAAISATNVPLRIVTLG